MYDWGIIENYARVVDLKEIEGNDFNLNVSRYIENGEKEEEIDVSVVKKELVQLEKERDQINKKVEGYLKELKY